jgi:hypothetical protein
MAPSPRISTLVRARPLKAGYYTMAWEAPVTFPRSSERGHIEADDCGGPERGPAQEFPQKSEPRAAFEILRRPQYRDALDMLAVEMAEVAAVTGQQEIRLAVNRRQQDRPILWIKPDTGGQLEVLRWIDERQLGGQQFQAGQSRRTVQSQVPARLLNRIGRAQQLDIFKLPEPGKSGTLQICSGKQEVGVEKNPIQGEASRRHPALLWPPA